MQRIIIFLLMLIAASNVYSQETITRYFDSSWRETSKGSAFYYTNFVKQDTAYKVTSYWAQSYKLYAVSTYADTNFIKGIGLSVCYYESGNVSDSIYFRPDGGIQSDKRFHENGKPDFYAFYDEAERYVKGVQYDSNGNKKPGYFTFQKEAMFTGGMVEWNSYLQTHLKANTPAKRKAPPGIYKVTVSFIVDEKGKVSNVTALNDPGYGTAEEAVRVVQNSPAWVPAMQNNKAVVYRQRQNIVFQVTEK